MPEPLTSEEIKTLYGHPPSVALRNRLLAEIERLQARVGRLEQENAAWQEDVQAGYRRWRISEE